MSPTRRWTTFLIAIVALASVASAQTPQDQVVDFHYYPDSARPCLYEASNTSTCDYSSVPIYNACLCSNGGEGFLNLAASCIGAQDSNDLTIVYNTLSANCAHSKTPIVYSLQQWLQHAAQATLSSAGGAGSTPAPTTAPVAHTTAGVATVTFTPTAGGQAGTSVVTFNPGQTASVITLSQGGTTIVTLTGATSTPAASSDAGSSSNNNNKGGSKLSTGALAGIVIGAVVILLAVLALVWLLTRHRRRDTPDEAQYLPPPVMAGVYGGQEKEVAHTSHEMYHGQPGMPVYAHRATPSHPVQDAPGTFVNRDDPAVAELHGRDGAALHELPP